jgi:hypothetical protein
MATDYFNGAYKTTLAHQGTNLRGTAISRGIKEFERYLTTTPTRQEITRDTKKLYVSIQKSQQTAVGDRYEKNILGSLADNLKIGDIFQWQGENWIILTQDRLTIPTHFKGKIRFCNYNLKWNYGGLLYQTPGHIITSRAFAMEEGQKAGLTWDDGAMVVLAIVPSNAKTKTIERYRRFIIKGKAWQVVSTDELSVENLLFIRLEEDQIDLATDDVQNEIADKYIPSDDGQTIGAEYFIEGPDKLIWNQSKSFQALKDGDIIENVIFTIDASELATIEGEITANPVNVRANTAGITGEFILTCEYVDDDQTVAKKIQVTSLWG